MKHTSVIHRRDLAIGTFFTQISMTFNKVLYSFFAVFFAYGEWNSLFSSFGVVEVLFFVYLFFFYLILILFFVGSFGVAMALFGSMFKKGVLGSHDFEFNDDEFVESTEYNKSHHKYNAISNVFTRLGTIYITMPGAQWHILPKRDFENTQRRDELLSFLREARNA
ncbi:YcxB family protein [Teredinibacter haidensis]|uniref:YcxB family protein n=1 Tax=Teredinibacter haidensis TaxID=2731755 RepID=UPI000948B2C6|nr:YcxB family protein [Teredinibacter haidensis]